MALLKDYIKTLKSRRKAIKDSQDMKEQEASDAQEAKIKFLQKWFDITASMLEGVFILDDEMWSKVSDDSVNEQKVDILEQEKLVQSLEDKTTEMVESGAGQDSMKPIEKRFGKLIEEKNKYSVRVDQEVRDREVEPHKNFNKSKLNLKFPKFKGYKGIYTFKTGFDKLLSQDNSQRLVT